VARAFVSYKRGVNPDEYLADYIVKFLSERGHHLFIDKEIEIGQEWPAVIERELQQADFLIVLVSQHSAASEMVVEEVLMACQKQKSDNKPAILPVRVAYTGSLPYHLGAKLDPVQFELWKGDGDEERIGECLSSVLDREPDKSQRETSITPDAPSKLDRQEEPAPLPAFNPDWLDALEAPGGAVKMQSPFYIERETDERLKRILLKTGRTIRIKGSRQMGKSSLLARLYQHARENHLSALFIDFQHMEEDFLRDFDTLLRYLANFIARKLKLDSSIVERYWTSILSSADKLSDFIETEVLTKQTGPLLLLMDEVDRLFAFDRYRNDFFGLVRSWHNNRAFDPLWDHLSLVLTYSTDATYFITDLNQSPFNVGESAELADFSGQQVEDLNERHGSPMKNAELNSLMEQLNGHPFLTRKAFYHLVTDRLTVQELMEQACNDTGPFCDHLHHLLWRLHKDPEMRDAMKSVIQHHSCSTDQAFLKLWSAGAIRGSDRENAVPRCGLYTRYFEKRL